MKMTSFSIRPSCVDISPAAYTKYDLTQLLFPVDDDITLQEHIFDKLRTTGIVSVDGTSLKKNVTLIFGDDSSVRATELHKLLGLSISFPRMFKLQSVRGRHSPFPLSIGNASGTNKYLKFKFMEKEESSQIIFVDSAESNAYFTATWEIDEEKNDIIVFNIISQGYILFKD